jgi:hypothetical protein
MNSIMYELLERKSFWQITEIQSDINTQDNLMVLEPAELSIRLHYKKQCTMIKWHDCYHQF